MLTSKVHANISLCIMYVIICIVLLKILIYLLRCTSNNINLFHKTLYSIVLFCKAEQEIPDARQPPLQELSRDEQGAEQQQKPMMEDHQETKEERERFIAESIKCANIPDKTKLIKKYIKEHGLDNLYKFLDDELDYFKKVKVNIVVTGQSGQGKSSLINCLRNMTAKSEGAADVGVTQTTMEPTPYPHPRLRNVILWDMPGFNTEDFKRDTYLERMKFDTFDAVIICSSERFKEDHMWIAQEARNSKKPFYIVRTKIDQDIANDKRENDDHNEKKLLSDIRQEISRNLKKENFEAVKIFLLSTVTLYSSQWDYPSFTEELIKNTPGKNQEVLILALYASSKSAIARKKDIMLKRIPNVCLRVAAAKTVEDKKAVIKKEQQLCIEIFGLTTEDMTAQGLDQLDIKCVRETATYIGAAIPGIISNGLIGLGIAGPAGAAVAGFIAAVTATVLVVTNSIQTKASKEWNISSRILVDVIDRYEKEALKILEKIMAARSS